MNRNILSLCALSSMLAACASGPPLLPDSTPPLRPITAAAVSGGLVRVPVADAVTVLDFWATTCEPCKALMPKLEELQASMRNQGVVVVGVATEDNPGKVRDYLAAAGISYPNILDGERGAFGGAYKVNKLPTTLVFDRRMRLRYQEVGGGPETAPRIEAVVEALTHE